MGRRVVGVSPKGLHGRQKEGRQLLLMAIPGILFIVLFSYLPLRGWIYAFFDYKPGRALADSSFVGLKYFPGCLPMALCVLSSSECWKIP